jgi:glycosyltransferase involved in cell wall biosynthesis
MKILIASDLYWPAVNGVATFSRNLAQGLAAQGHEVLVIAPSQTGKKYKEVDGNYVIVRTAAVPFPFYQNFMISLTPYSEVKKVINEFQPDIIHIQMLIMIGQSVMKYGNKLGIPIVSTNHAMPENLMDNLRLLAPIARPINFMLKRYGTRFYSKSDYITMPTKAAIGMFGSSVSKVAPPIEAVSNGINLSRFKIGISSKEVIKKFNIPTDRPVISYIGRLDAEKHLSVLIRAFQIVLTKKKAHLLIVGFGTDSNNLKLLAYELGLSKQITFTGRVSDEEIVELHKVGTVFCMPSPAELQSIAALEAMASGKPIVAVDAGALKELCQDKRNGYLCRQDDDKQIADSLLKIITDAKLCKSMGAESAAIAATHDLRNTIKRFEEIYTSLLDS